MSLSNSNIIKGDSGQVLYPSFDFLEIGDSVEGADHIDNVFGDQGPEAGEESGEPEQEEDVVGRLQRELEERLLEMEARAQEVEQQAYRSGFERGYQEGTEKAEREIREQTAPLETLLDQLARQTGMVLDDYRQWLIDAAVAIAAQLVRRESLERPGWLVELVERALNQARKDHHVTVYFHPEDLQLLERHGCIEQLRERRDNLVCEADPELERGGCRVESDFRLLDCTLETRTRLALEALSTDAEAADE